MTISSDVLTAFGSLAAAAFAAICAYLAQLIRAHFNARQVSTAEQLAGIAVRAAEQMGKAAGWDGSVKLKSALDDLRSLAAKQGISLTADQQRAIIEQAVLILKQANSELTAPAVVPPVAVRLTAEQAAPIAELVKQKLGGAETAPKPAPEPQPDQPPAPPKSVKKVAGKPPKGGPT